MLIGMRGKLTPNTVRVRHVKVKSGSRFPADHFTVVDESSFFEIIQLKEIYNKMK